jgi:bacteriocin-like protein
VTRILERLGSDDEAIILRAAFGILDRAGLETASKSSSKVDVDIDVRSLSDDELQAIVGGTGGG